MIEFDEDFVPSVLKNGRSEKLPGELLDWIRAIHVEPVLDDDYSLSHRPSHEPFERRIATTFEDLSAAMQDCTDALDQAGDLGPTPSSRRTSCSRN